jgi:hypothetical protein
MDVVCVDSRSYLEINEQDQIRNETVLDYLSISYTQLVLTQLYLSSSKRV